MDTCRCPGRHFRDVGRCSHPGNRADVRLQGLSGSARSLPVRTLNVRQIPNGPLHPARSAMAAQTWMMHSRRRLATIAGCSARRKPLEYTPAISVMRAWLCRMPLSQCDARLGRGQAGRDRGAGHGWTDAGGFKEVRRSGVVRRLGRVLPCGRNGRRRGERSAPIGHWPPAR